MLSPRPTDSKNGFRILVVDDERPVRMVAQRMLERLGHLTWSAAGPDEALELASTASPAPEVVMVDMRLGDEDGLELAAALHRALPDAALILMGGDLDQAARQLQRATPRAHLLPKPFAFAELRGVMAAIQADCANSMPVGSEPCMPPPGRANFPLQHGR